MSTLSLLQSSVDELSVLSALCDEGRRHFRAAALAADDIPTRALCLYKERRCAEMARELGFPLLEAGRRRSPAVELGEISSEKLRMLRCLNWQEAAVVRYELALQRPGLAEEDRFMLSRHHQWLKETSHSHDAAGRAVAA